MNGNLAELHSPIINSSDTSKGYSNFLNKLIITLEGITPIKVARVKNKENEWFNRGSCRKNIWRRFEIENQGKFILTWKLIKKSSSKIS